jgi:hypothetical protein
MPTAQRPSYINGYAGRKPGECVRYDWFFFETCWKFGIMRPLPCKAGINQRQIRFSIRQQW